MTDDRGQTSDRVTLCVPSHPKYLYVIRSVLYPLALEAGFPKREARRIVLAVDEACSNVIKYAYEGDASKQISVSVGVGRSGLRIEVSDTGKKPDVAKIAPRMLEEIRPGGLGTHFMAEVFDSVAYDTGREAGTVLILIKERR